MHIHLCAVQIHYNGGNTWIWIDFDFVGIYGSVSFWYWTNRWYVGMVGVCLNQSKGALILDHVVVGIRLGSPYYEVLMNALYNTGLMTIKTTDIELTEN